MVAAAVVAVAPRLHLDDAVLVVQDAVLLLRAAAALVLLDGRRLVDVVERVDLHTHQIVELVRPGLARDASVPADADLEHVARGALPLLIGDHEGDRRLRRRAVGVGDAVADVDAPQPLAVDGGRLRL